MLTIKQGFKGTLLAAAMVGLTACGGSSGSSEGTGSFSLSVTDAPVDSANHVVVSFSGVAIKPLNGEELVFAFDEPKDIDLLSLQGTSSEGLLTGEEVPAGEYEWIRLAVNATLDGTLDSYIELDDGTQHELWIPSGGETGLKLVSGFTVATGGSVDFTIDFDLRKSVTAPPVSDNPNAPTGMAGYILRPALRVVNNIEVGSIAGVIDELIIAAQCVNASENSGAVYVYTGADVTPVDVSGAETDPLASALVSSEDYSYEVGFLLEGTYTLAYTCDAVNDDPTAVDELAFVGAANVDVTAGAQTTHDITVEEEMQ